MERLKEWAKAALGWVEAKPTLAFIILIACLAVVGIAFASPAHANGNHGKNSHGSDSASHSVSESISTVGDISIENTVNVPSGGAQALADGAVRVNPSLSSGDVNTNVEIVNPDDIRIKNTPDVRAPYMNTTSPCRVGISGGIGIAGFGGNAGTTIEDKECTLRQTAQTFSALGVPGAGLWLLCRSQAMERVGVDADTCDAMIAQMQIEAELTAQEVSYETVGKLELAQHSDDDYEEVVSELEALRREVRELEAQKDSKQADIDPWEDLRQQARKALPKPEPKDG